MCIRDRLSDPDSVNRACASVAGLKQRLTALGFTLKRSDPLRVTINARAWGWSGTEFAAFLRAHGAECEMADENYVVLLFSAITSPDDCQRAEVSLELIPRRTAKPLAEYPVIRPKQETSIREAVFAKQHSVSVDEANGKVCGGIQVSCPPGIPIVMPGERIDSEAVEALKLYGVKSVEILD